MRIDIEEKTEKINQFLNNVYVSKGFHILVQFMDVGALR